MESAELLHALRRNGIADEAVLSAMERTPRHLFVPENQSLAYQDKPLPIGFGQTISQPWMVAAMTSALRLRGSERVLEIGTGSGYQAAVLARLVPHVFTIERIPELSSTAQLRLLALGLDNVHFSVGDGSEGWKAVDKWPEVPPFEAIIVTCAAPALPQPLLEQLAQGGRLVIPVAAGEHEKLHRVTRREGGNAPSAFQVEILLECTFVPLIGTHGYAP